MKQKRKHRRGVNLFEIKLSVFEFTK